MNLEHYFSSFRQNIVGQDASFVSPYGEKKIVYFDWTASGRLYQPIEDKMNEHFHPFIGNTHTETTVTGSTMTRAYHHALSVIKNHVHADKHDVILTAGTGATGAINKLQRILGLRVPEPFNKMISIPSLDKPIVFVTHAEHHSNHTSWLETIADVEVIHPDDKGNVSLSHFHELLEKYKERKHKFGAFTACSNVTGMVTPYHTLAKMIHEYDGICLVDFSASAPYVEINMHPENPMEKLDAIVFSPHKFLGGPGTNGVLVFDSRFYQNEVPDCPGGGTVKWTNPWGGRSYYPDIETREDGGTPGFLQAIRTSLSILVKEQMKPELMLKREEELLSLLFSELSTIPTLRILNEQNKNRLGIVSLYLENIHFNLLVKLLNDRFGIQARGGCSCAGTYGHFLLGIDQKTSRSITDKIDEGFISAKPGWVRISLHPTIKNEEILYLSNSLKEIVNHIDEWKEDYSYDSLTNEFTHKTFKEKDISEDFHF